MTRHLPLATGLLSLGLLSGCDMFGFHEWRWHQKLTVTVDTPDGPKTGSAVTRVSVSASPRWWGLGDAAGSGGSSLSGEAVTVDLGNGRYLFALLKDYNFETARETFIPKEAEPRTEAQAIEVYDRLEKIRGSRELAYKHYPLLVTFDEISNPASVKKVNPTNLAAVFGLGYRLASVEIAITDEPITTGKVKSIMPWLEHYYNRRFDGQRFGTIKTDNPFANSLASGAFDTEMSK